MLTNIPSKVDSPKLKTYIKKAIEKTYPAYKNPVTNQEH